MSRLAFPLSRRSLIPMKMLADLLIGLSAVLLIVQVWPSETLDFSSTELPLSPATLFLIAIGVRLTLSRPMQQTLALKFVQNQVPVDDVSEAFIRTAEEAFVKRFGYEALAQATDTFTRPAAHFDRVKEVIEIQASRYERRTTLVVATSSSEVVLVPLLSQTKGDLIDDLSLQIDGKPFSTLAYLENQGAMLLIVEGLFVAIAEASALVRDSEVEASAKRVVAAPHKVNQRAAIGLLDAWVGGPNSGNAHYQTLRNLMQQCAREYLIFCAAPGSASGSIKLTLTSSFERSSKDYSALQILRVALGLRRRDHLFQLERATTTPSYHLQLRAPRGLYVHEQHLAAVLVRDDQSKVGAATIPVDEQVSASTKSVHVYLRGQHALGQHANVPTLRVNFRERPPGLLEIGLLVSLGLFVLTWIVGVNHDRIFYTSPPPGAWPTILFGIPTLVSGWIFSRLDAAALAKMSIITLLSLFWLLLNAGLAVTAVAFKSGKVQITEESFSLLGLTSSHPLWALVMVSCGMHLVTVCYLACVRATRYALISSGLTDNRVPEHNERDKP